MSISKRTLAIIRMDRVLVWSRTEPEGYLSFTRTTLVACAIASTAGELCRY